MADSSAKVVEEVQCTLSDPAFGNDMLSVLNDLRAEGVLLDVTVVAGEEEFRAHSTVLAYGSDYFRRLFASGMKESQDNRVELKDPCISAKGFRLLLNFLYSGELAVSTESVYDVLLVANHLQVETIVKLCYDFISQNMRDAPLELVNYTEAQKVADAYGLTILQEKVHSALAENFLELSTSEDFLQSTTPEQLVTILQANNVASPSELQLYQAVVRWLMHDEQARMPHAAEVLSHVRFALLDQNTLYGLLQVDLAVMEHGRHLILEAMAYHSLSPETRQGIDWPRSKPRTSVDEKVLLALQSDLSKAWRYTANGWIEEEGNVCPPDDIRAVAVSKEGNLISKAYCYDISKKQWMKIPSFPRSSQGVALTSCQGAVFAVGGYVQGIVDGKGTVVPTSVVHTFFPPNNAWEAVSPTTRPHAEAAAMVQGDIIYIAGGKTLRNGKVLWCATVEMCRADLKVTMKGSPWSVVPQPPCVYKFASQVAVLDRKAYFILGGQMHFTGKLVDHDRTSEEDVEDMCQAFRKDLESSKVTKGLSLTKVNRVSIKPPRLDTCRHNGFRRSQDQSTPSEELAWTPELLLLTEVFGTSSSKYGKRDEVDYHTNYTGYRENRSEWEFAFLRAVGNVTTDRSIYPEGVNPLDRTAEKPDRTRGSAHFLFVPVNPTLGHLNRGTAPIVLCSGRRTWFRLRGFGFGTPVVSPPSRSELADSHFQGFRTASKDLGGTLASLCVGAGSVLVGFEPATSGFPARRVVFFAAKQVPGFVRKNVIPWEFCWT
ncbi:hypothetical protein Bbelb_300360 [Branchiostoma belcheri]|nr:hypothetical protein Bbelb_300360 [Branchiostoma belcheri]